MKKYFLFLSFILVFQSLCGTDLLFVELKLSDDPIETRQHIYSIYKLDLSIGSLQFIREFRINGNSFYFYSEYENKTYIFENWRQPNREQNTYTIEKINGEFVVQKQDFRFITEDIFIDRESSPQRVLVPSDHQPNYIVDKEYYMINYDYRFQYRSGWKNFGPKYCEIRKKDNEKVYSFFLQPHDGFNEKQQLYFNTPRILGDDKIIYDNRMTNNKTFLYDYINESLESLDGFLHGVSYLGKSFVISDSQSTKVYDEDLNVLNDLSEYPISNKVHIYKNILFSYSPYIPGWFWKNNFLVYDVKKKEEIFFEENSDIFDSGNYWFLGFYE